PSGPVHDSLPAARDACARRSSGCDRDGPWPTARRRCQPLAVCDDRPGPRAARTPSVRAAASRSFLHPVGGLEVIRLLARFFFFLGSRFLGSWFLGSRFLGGRFLDDRLLGRFFFRRLLRGLTNRSFAARRLLDRFLSRLLRLLGDDRPFYRRR